MRKPLTKGERRWTAEEIAALRERMLRATEAQQKEDARAAAASLLWSRTRIIL